MTDLTKIVLMSALGILAPSLADAQQKAASQAPKVQATPAYNGTINQTPWFSNPALRQQLKLNDVQFNQLNKAYGNSWNQYQQGLNGLGANLTPAQRIQRSIELQQSFNNSFGTPANKILTDPQTRTRFNQLNMQYHGYNSLLDPSVQSKLNLTAAQQQTLGQYQAAWHKSMGDLRQQYQTNPQAAATQMQTLRQQEAQRLNSVLTDQQRQTWNQMTGTPYNFPPNVYFPTSNP